LCSEDWGAAFRPIRGGLPPHWLFVVLGNEDFDLFADDLDSTALQMYRLLDQERQLLAVWTQLVDPNGFVNLYGFA
jgi:hypothetical protein